MPKKVAKFLKLPNYGWSRVRLRDMPKVHSQKNEKLALLVNKTHFEKLSLELNDETIDTN